jgi:hypothetical protein
MLEESMPAVMIFSSEKFEGQKSKQSPSSPTPNSLLADMDGLRPTAFDHFIQ